MTDFLQPVRRGDSLPTDSRFFNAVAQLGRNARNGPGMSGFSVQGKTLAYGVLVNVINDTSHDYTPFQPVHLKTDDISAKPSNNEALFRAGPAYFANSSVANQDCRGNWGVVVTGLEKKHSGKATAGLALLTGVAVVKVTKRAGADLYVDTGGTSDSADNYKLSTRGAGAGKLLWIDPALADDAEGWAVVQVFGRQCVEPQRWATLAADLYRPGHTSGATKVSATVQYRTPTLTLSGVTPARTVQVICDYLKDNEKLAAGTTVQICPEPYSGIWEVTNSKACPT